MTAAPAFARPRGAADRLGSVARTLLSRRVRLVVVLVVVLLVLWEGGKALFGVPWRSGGQVIWNPPFRFAFFSDLNLPHVWNIAGAFFKPWQRGQDLTLLQYLAGAALYTWREAAIGFGVGAALGLGLASAFIHSRLLERSLVPYVVASQTIPIIALAPMVVFAVGQSVLAVVFISAYLTFFPVTVAMLRGLRSFDPRALELMRSYASSRRTTYRKLRLPASLPYLFTALKIAATASIVGAIIGEDVGSIKEGLGRVIGTFNQYYITGPEKLWCAIIATAVLGAVFYGCVWAVERRVLRWQIQALAR